jgi:hypothetical protein
LKAFSSGQPHLFSDDGPALVHTEAGVGTITLLDTLIGDGKDAQ